MSQPLKGNVQLDEQQRLIRQLRDTVRREISAVGGYWPPAVAMGDTMQSLGEASDAHLRGESPACARHLANALWVLACISNQYCARPLAVSPQEDEKAQDVTQSILRSFSYSGQVARHVNRYEYGVYADDRAGQSIAIPIQRAQLAILEALTLLNEDATTMMNRRRDEVRSYRGRPDLPSINRFDPTTSPTLNRFHHLAAQTMCPYAAKGKYWGAEEWPEHLDAADYVRVCQQTLDRFSRVAPIEQIDALVIERSGVQNMHELTTDTSELLTAIGRLVRPNPLTQLVESRHWRYSLPNRTESFLAVFSSIYESTHPRHSSVPGSTFFVLQTQASFKARNVREEDRIRVRTAFAQNDQDYTAFLAKVRFEAEKYVKPLDLSDDPVRWWK